MIHEEPGLPTSSLVINIESPHQINPTEPFIVEVGGQGYTSIYDSSGCINSIFTEGVSLRHSTIMGSMGAYYRTDQEISMDTETLTSTHPGAKITLAHELGHANDPIQRNSQWNTQLRSFRRGEVQLSSGEIIEAYINRNTDELNSEIRAWKIGGTFAQRFGIELTLYDFTNHAKIYISYYTNMIKELVEQICESDIEEYNQGRVTISSPLLDGSMVTLNYSDVLLQYDDLNRTVTNTRDNLIRLGLVDKDFS
jgi:hypothetical protein